MPKVTIRARCLLYNLNKTLTVWWGLFLEGGVYAVALGFPVE